MANIVVHVRQHGIMAKVARILLGHHQSACWQHLLSRCLAKFVHPPLPPPQIEREEIENKCQKCRTQDVSHMRCTTRSTRNRTCDANGDAFRFRKVHLQIAEQEEESVGKRQTTRNRTATCSSFLFAVFFCFIYPLPQYLIFAIYSEYICIYIFLHCIPVPPVAKVHIHGLTLSLKKTYSLSYPVNGLLSFNTS